MIRLNLLIIQFFDILKYIYFIKKCVCENAFTIIVSYSL